MIARLVAGAAAFLAACASAPAPEPPPPLAGTRWIGVVAGDPDPRTLPRLEFIGTRVTGYTGCNMLNGGWRTEGTQLRIGPLVTTKRACAGPEGDVEQRFIAAAAGPATREGDRLVFTGPNGERFEFRAAAAS